MREQRRKVVSLSVRLAGAVALMAGEVAERQQAKGEPFSTEVMKLKDGLYVIPG